MERSFLPAIADYIRRQRIDALYEKGLLYSLVLVMAGPGYGKTLSLASFMSTADVRLAWLRLFDHRAKEGEFWEDFVRAAERELPEYAPGLERLGFPADAARFDVFARRTAEAAGGGKRLVLVVDGYEQVHSGGVTRFLDTLVNCDLPNFTMFLLCNVMLPYAGALPATGQFRITDERPERPEDFGGKMAVQMPADLYEQHYFRAYPADVQNQLIRLAVLPRFSMDMARLGLESKSSELFNLLMQHPFVSYDYTADLFGFQPMYRDFLRRKETFISPGSRRELRVFAGRWFLAQGLPNEAMDCFWEAEEYGGFLDVLYRWPKTHKRVSVPDGVLRRLLQIPADYAAQNPAVEFCIAFMHLNAGEVDRAKEKLLALAARLEGREDAEGRQLLGDICAALSDIAIYQNEDTALEWMQRAYALIPGGSRIHEAALMAVGNNSVFYLPGREAGQLERIVDYFFAYAPLADKVKNGCGYGYEYLFAGEAAYYREDMERAATLYNSAIMKASRTGQHDILCNAMWGLGRIELYYANYRNALALQEQVTGYINESHITALYELRDCGIAWFYMRLGDLERVPPEFGELLPGTEEAPVSLGRDRLTTAFYLYLKGDLIKAQAVILQLESLLESSGRWAEKLTLCLLGALCHLSKGEAELFEKAFRKAYGMVRDNDIKVALSEYGKEMLSAIEQIKRMGADGYDMEWLAEVYRDALSYAKRVRVMQAAHKGSADPVHSSVALTKREDETLRHLAKGLSQEEIGKLMGISVNAVKKHISKIYNKLGAVNREDAIHIATIHGLVDVLSG